MVSTFKFPLFYHSAEMANFRDRFVFVTKPVSSCIITIAIYYHPYVLSQVVKTSLVAFCTVAFRPDTATIYELRQPYFGSKDVRLFRLTNVGFQ